MIERGNPLFAVTPVTRKVTKFRDTTLKANSSSSTRQLGCVFQDMEPPKLSSILRKSSYMQKPIQRVKLTKAIARHTKFCKGFAAQALGPSCDLIFRKTRARGWSLPEKPWKMCCQGRKYTKCPSTHDNATLR